MSWLANFFALMSNIASWYRVAVWQPLTISANNYGICQRSKQPLSGLAPALYAQKITGLGTAQKKKWGEKESG
jgi:hypothetical protein